MMYRSFFIQLRTREALAAAAIFAGMAILWFSPAFLEGKTLLLRDLHSQFYGPRWWYRECLMAGELPSWNPWILCGTPFLANPQNAVFYPGTLLFLIFPVSYALSVYSAVHCWWLAFSVYLLARELGGLFIGALLSGIIAGYAGMPLKEIEYPELLAGLAWTPMVFLAGWRCCSNPNARTAALLALGLGLQLLAGSPYPPLYSIIGLGLMMLAWSGYDRGRVVSWSPLDPYINYRRFAALVVGGMGGAMFACIQYIPTLVLLKSASSDYFSGRMPKLFSLRLRDTLNLLSPWLAGYPQWQKCFFVGLPALVLGLLGLLQRGRVSVMTTPSERVYNLWSIKRLWLLGLLAGGWIFAQAGYLQIDRLLEFVPLVGRATKWPTLGLSIVVVSIALFAGEGLDRLYKGSFGPSYGRGALWSICLFFLVLIGIDFLFRGAGVERIRVWLNQDLLSLTSRSLSEQTMQPRWIEYQLSLGALGLLFFTGLASVSRFRPASCWALLLLVSSDLYFQGRGLNFFSTVDLYNENPLVLNALPKARDLRGTSRIFVPQQFNRYNDIAYGSSSLDDFRLLRSLLTDDTAMNWRVATTQGGGSICLPDYQFRLQPILDQLAGKKSDENDRVLGAWNIGYLSETVATEGQLHLGLRANPRLLAHARLVQRAVEVDDLRESLTAIREARWNPDTAMVTKGSSLAPIFYHGRTNFGPNTDEVIEGLHQTAHTLAMECNLSADAILVVAENWADGWKVMVDGKLQPLLRVNYLQLGVALPPGIHRVNFDYTAPGLLWGGVVSGVTMLWILAVLARPTFYSHELARWN